MWIKNRILVHCSATALCLLLAGSALSRDIPGQGPLSIRSQNPGQSFRLSMLPQDARPQPGGQVRLLAGSTISNIWARDPAYLFDFHMNDKFVALEYGLNGKLTAGLGITERRIQNMRLDQTVLSFHKLFGLDQDGRDQVTKNDLQVSIPAYGIDMRYSDLNRMVLTRAAEWLVRYTLVDGNHNAPTLSLFAQAKYEVGGDSLIHSDTLDRMLGIAVTLPAPPHLYHINLGYGWFGQNDYLGIPLKKQQVSLMLAWEYPVSSHTSLVTQYLLDEPVFIGLGELSEPAHQLQMGLKWKRKNMFFQAGFVENLFTFYNSPDISFSLLVGLRL